MSSIFSIHRLLFVLLLLTLLYPSLAYATCTYPGTGNWDILTSEDCYVNDTSITLNGNLTVFGNLTFDNVTPEDEVGDITATAGGGDNGWL